MLGIKAIHEETEVRDKKILESIKCLLRNDITEIYKKYKGDGEIPLFELENVTLLYERYKSLDGNSFIDKFWDEIQDWTVTK